MRGKPKRSRKTRRAARKTPAYERDDGPLTEEQIAAIKKLVPQGRGMRIASSLFPDETARTGGRTGKRRGK